MAVDLEDRGQALENEYFRRKEHELIAKMKERLADENAKTLEEECPKCDGNLVETAFEDVKVDVCNKCSGVWFDPGELCNVMDKEENEGWFGRFFG